MVSPESSESWESVRLTGTEIGEMTGVDYSTASQGRKRLRETLKRDRNLLRIIETIEANLLN